MRMKVVGPEEKVKITLKVNGNVHEVEVEPRRLLVHVLRDLGYKSVRVGVRHESLRGLHGDTQR